MPFRDAPAPIELPVVAVDEEHLKADEIRSALVVSMAFIVGVEELRLLCVVKDVVTFDF